MSRENQREFSSTMRVIAGKYRSRQIKSLPELDTRPTYDRLRETLFSILASSGKLEGAVFVDLFAGTGSIGIEALSRGASMAYFVESNRKAANLIRENLRVLGISAGAEVQEREVVPAIGRLSAAGVRCDVCFLDPPYAMQGAYEQVLRVLSTSELLRPSSIVIAEHDKRFDPGEGRASIKRYRRLDQGESSLSFYRVEVDQEELLSC
ncbi:MAG TPA: 16S rRNA (guanine(966)-N(2))-methyltransferase RsmD [Clostridia bacterium]|nr:16S rRNA (guanine(966)-N(2))-methyltransferase RsmD [Clostridia bacterium]